MDKLIGLNELKLKGSRFEVAYGTSKFVNFSLNGKNYCPIISAKANTFGVKNNSDRSKVLIQIEESKKSLLFYAKSSNFELNGPFIAGFTNAILGQSLWSPFNGFNLGRIKDYKKIKISVDFKYHPISGHSNFILDLFLTKNKGILNHNDTEIEIWLETNFNPPGNIFFENENYKIFYLKKKDLAKNWFNVIVKKNTEVDLIDIFRIVKTRIKNLDEFYFNSIDFGCEFSNNTEVRTELTKLNFEFVKK